MSNRVFRSGSYDEALGIIAEYVTPVTRQEYNESKENMKKNYDR